MLHADRHPVSPCSRLLALGAAFALALGSTACGGGGDEPSADAGASSGASITSTLLDDEGRMLPASVRPADAGARTRSTGYATEAQAQQLEAALGDDVLGTEVTCCGANEADLAVLTVWGMQAARDLPPSTPVLVRGADQRLAATVAQRLADAGFTRVWLVVR